MDKKQQILFCQCAYAEVLPTEVKNAVEKALRGAGVEFEGVADLCGLAARDDERLREYAKAGELKIAACYPRAVRWLFAAAGADLGHEGVEILNMREETAEEIITALVGEQSCSCKCSCLSTQTEPAAEEATTEQRDEWVPWFPVIDYERCVGCGQCRDFCLFGVFETDADGKIRVKNPQNCKTYCPACARICPEAAIMFPKYEHGPINGSEDEAAEGKDITRVDIAKLIEGDIYATLRQRGQGKKRFAGETEVERALTERQKCACLSELEKKLNLPPEIREALCGTKCGEKDCTAPEAAKESVTEPPKKECACNCECEGKDEEKSGCE